MSFSFNGSLFKNEDCDESRNQPNFTGVASIRQEQIGELISYLMDCKCAHNEYDGDHIPLRMSGWAKVSKNGKKFMSLSFQPDQKVLETKKQVKTEPSSVKSVSQAMDEGDLF